MSMKMCQNDLRKSLQDIKAPRAQFGHKNGNNYIVPKIKITA